MSRFIIVGDTDQYEGCLICTCGGNKEQAYEVLERMRVNPTDNDKMLIKGHRNLRVEEAEAKDCWWEEA